LKGRTKSVWPVRLEEKKKLDETGCRNGLVLVFELFPRRRGQPGSVNTANNGTDAKQQRYDLDLPTRLYVAASEPLANRLISSLPNVPSFPGCPFPGHLSTPPLAPFRATSIIPFARSVDEIAEEGKIVARALTAPKRSGWRYKKEPSGTGCEGRMVIGRKMKGAREEEEGEEEGKAARRRSALPVNMEAVSMEVDKERVLLRC
jgi:hypothetical protein